MHNLKIYKLKPEEKKYNKMYMLISTERIHQNTLFYARKQNECSWVYTWQAQIKL